METIPLHTCVAKLAGQWNEVGERRLRPVEACVKAGNLQGSRKVRCRVIKNFQLSGKMQRSKRHGFVEQLQNSRCDGLMFT